jgi:hypothetical protein
VNDELNKLERDVEQEMDLLRDIPEVTAGAECMVRVKAAVVAEARRMVRRRRVLRWTGTGIGAVAAVLLVVVGISLWHRRQLPRPSSDVALTEWASALDESNARLASLFSPASDTSEDENAELDELFRSLDESLRQFENLASG